VKALISRDRLAVVELVEDWENGGRPVEPTM